MAQTRKRTYRSRTRTQTVKKKTPKGGLNATEKKQVNELAKKVVNRMTETKYFDCKSLQNALSLHRARSNINGIGVRGFATCEDRNSQGTRIQYGRSATDNSVQYLTELNMNKCFANDDADAVSPNAVVGHYCNPSLALSEFILERDYIQTAGAGSDYTTLNVSPYFVRVLRLVPRPTKLSTVDIDPENDAFVNELGTATGCADSGFGPQELMLFKANSRKYKVVADLKFEMIPPFTTTEIDTGAGTDALVTNIAKSGFMKKLVMKHNIGKKLYFESGGNVSENSTVGQQNEFILFHTCPLGINAQAALSSTSALNMLIAGKFVSTFKDT